VREFQLLPARGRLKSRITRWLAALDAPKEARKRQIEAVQHCVLTLAVHAREPGFFATQRRDLSILHLRRDVDAPRFPSVTSLIKERVVRLAS
jgi:hypothetical protein